MPIPLIPGFSGSPQVGPAPLTVNFADTSDGAIYFPVSWEWDFGDGSPIDTTQNPIHTYTSAGSYTVSLSVMWDNGDGPSWTYETNYITVGGGADYILTPPDSGKETRVTNGNLYTNVHIPTDIAQPNILVGMVFYITKISAGAVYIVNDGVILNTSASLTLLNLGDTVRLIKVGPGEWDMQSWGGSVRTTPTGSVVAGTGPLVPTSSDGFLYIPVVSGVPINTPTPIPGFAPMVIDNVHNRLYIYVSGQWLAVNVAVYS